MGEFEERTQAMAEKKIRRRVELEKPEKGTGILVLLVDGTATSTLVKMNVGKQAVLSTASAMCIIASKLISNANETSSDGPVVIEKGE